MKVFHQYCAGLDVHNEHVVACRIVPNGVGTRHKDIYTFGRMTQDLLALRDWLAEAGVTHVAVEGAKQNWKPVYNILANEFKILIVDTRVTRFAAGRKNDVVDAQWIAELLQRGLLNNRYVLKEPQRDLSELVCYRAYLITERTREVKRVYNILPQASLKLRLVATDVVGHSGRALLATLVAGQDKPETLRQLTKIQISHQIAEISRALAGHIGETHCLLLILHLEHISALNDQLERLERQIDLLMTSNSPV